MIHQKLDELLCNIDKATVISPNFVSFMPEALIETQRQTKDVFSDKWSQYDYKSDDFDKAERRQKEWYLELYGFPDEKALSRYLQGCRVVLDAGAGLGYKAAWFAELSPSTAVIAVDISNSLYNAVEHYKHLDNLFFIQGDIGNMPYLRDCLFDYVSCDQVIHHTADPFTTFQELVRVTGLDKELSVYVYRKKALPRELVDDYFRECSKNMTHDTRMALSRQITELGKVLSSIKDEMEFPDVPDLGIEGGRMTVQRFIYWNFLKCFWNEGLGYKNSLMTNYDWYSPSQAFRYSESEFKEWIKQERLEEIYFHKELACYSGRFLKPSRPEKVSGVGPV